jgi:hypothetical protein
MQKIHYVVHQDFISFQVVWKKWGTSAPVSRLLIFSMAPRRDCAINDVLNPVQETDGHNWYTNWEANSRCFYGIRRFTAVLTRPKWIHTLFI